MIKEINKDNLIEHEDFLATSRRCHYNEFIADFYERFADEQQMPLRITSSGAIEYGKDENFVRRAKRVRECCSSWTFDFYRRVKFKNLIRVDRCDDRFCLNCQALAADRRYAQYGPILDSYSSTNDIYHVVFTVPNVDADRLADTVTLMLDRFAYLIRFFQGSKKIRGVNFEKYGFIGAVRALEITVSKRNGSYHPHLHCMFILKKDLDMSKIFWTRFSEDRTGRTSTRLFSEFEILLQRIWCLLILKEKVTKETIENINDVCGYPDGFSVVADLSNGDYHEVFKYAIKGTFKNETLFHYKAFLTLYIALFDRRCYQTYGCLSKYDFNSYDDSIGLLSADQALDAFLASFNELPVRIQELLSEILSDSKSGKYRYISKTTFTRHLRKLTEEEKQDFLNRVQDVLGEEVKSAEEKV